jgi:tRNA (guanine-N7-)-methyltransferase
MKPQLGAGDGNRTHTKSLGSSRSTIELHPQETKNEKTTHHRRSYVLRQGRITPAQSRALEALWPLYGIDCLLTETLAISDPTCLEIGFGMGNSLVTQAIHHPEINFIGIDVHKPGVGSLLLQLEKHSLSNVKVISHNAIEVLEKNIPDHGLAAIHIFFPDPWPKKRHHKRRLIQIDFVKLLHQKLKPQGILHLATDWEDYATQMKEVILASALFEPAAPLIERPLTKFEQRGKKLGHGVWDGVFKAKLNLK